MRCCTSVLRVLSGARGRGTERAARRQCQTIGTRTQQALDTQSAPSTTGSSTSFFTSCYGTFRLKKDLQGQTSIVKQCTWACRDVRTLRLMTDKDKDMVDDKNAALAACGVRLIVCSASVRVGERPNSTPFALQMIETVSVSVQ